MRHLLTKNQILKLFDGWILDPEQDEDTIRLDKGLPYTQDTMVYVYFVRVKNNRYKFDCYDIVK